MHAPIGTMIMLHGHPNKDGGNLTMKVLFSSSTLGQKLLKVEYPDVMMIAEESSSATKITGMKRDWWSRI